MGDKILIRCEIGGNDSGRLERVSFSWDDENLYQLPSSFIPSFIPSLRFFLLSPSIYLYLSPFSYHLSSTLTFCFHSPSSFFPTLPSLVQPFIYSSPSSSSILHFPLSFLTSYTVIQPSMHSTPLPLPTSSS